MENRILARLDGRGVRTVVDAEGELLCGVMPCRPFLVKPNHLELEWLLTLLSVLPLNTYTLEEWNEALSQAAGRRIFCPSYRTLSDYLHRLVLGVQ